MHFFEEVVSIETFNRKARWEDTENAKSKPYN